MQSSDRADINLESGVFHLDVELRSFGGHCTYGHIDSNLQRRARTSEEVGAAEAIERLVLCHAMQGLDVSQPAYQETIWAVWFEIREKFGTKDLETCGAD